MKKLWKSASILRCCFRFCWRIFEAESQYNSMKKEQRASKRLTKKGTGTVLYESLMIKQVSVWSLFQLWNATTVLRFHNCCSNCLITTLLPQIREFWRIQLNRSFHSCDCSTILHENQNAGAYGLLFLLGTVFWSITLWFYKCSRTGLSEQVYPSLMVCKTQNRFNRLSLF